MLFNSFPFLIFFPIVIILYFALPHRSRWALLLLASYLFYMCARPEYILIIIFFTLVSYYASIQMGKYSLKSKRKKILILSLVINLGVLFVFKYFDFFADSIRAVFKQYGFPYGIPELQLILPIGISFYTFKNLSYLIDVYREGLKPEKRFGYLALYVAFFPQLLAGPIESAKRLIPQFYEKYEFDYQRVTNGLKLMMWGFFQKMVIADTLAALVDPIYNNPTHYQGISLWLATIFFTFQIYYDFSGYSDIAIGAAQIMGYQTMENFNRPYVSKSIIEFWRRWHISLSTWLRDYLYIPMGGNRVSLSRWFVNLFVVFLLCGLWHGANWTFVIWGGLHGFYLIFSRWTYPVREKVIQKIGLDKTKGLHRTLATLTTFFCVVFAWIFFRANSLQDAFYIVSHLLIGWENLFTWEGLYSAFSIGASRFEWMVGLVSLSIGESLHFLQRQGNMLDWFSGKRIYWRWMAYYGMLVGILLFGQFRGRQFIYFQF